MSKTVLILGGSFAGLHVAHALLKKSIRDVKVILVSKSTHFYWNLASVRAIIPGQIEDDDIFKPLEDALARYPAESWELVIGSATHADFDSKTVDIAVGDGTARTISYDQLVLATGARTHPDAPWKATGSYEQALATLHATSAKVKDAQHIVVAGAGGTGIEVAGELGYEYGKTKEIVLLCAGDKLANGHGIAEAAANELRKLDVTIRYDARAAEVRPSGNGTGKTDVVLAGGETITTDLYLPTTGQVPNTEYIPARFLSTDQRSATVLVDEYLRVSGARDVWACGDVVSQPRAGFFITQKQAASVARNVEAALAGLKPTVAKGPPVDIFACAVGRGRGVGRVNNSIRMPSLVVWLAKGRNLGIPMLKGYIDGSVA
ncbi:hypothetical protein MYCTH_2310035 [Thermothelomyces thermophilus ATCC 42464]|uniref:FAD/NAD(P)-binding domain-containing protein n=1 Tax=Thermothelomyces thermophilus (strain ATCC 42464 / BCRC 31852 / DSM 1799) TaxID=573729 RepID=G2QKZ8_THET4|nr:uncharacterized protein MYCTH_2310035 [Thermothelomyces thermophilus ATCC 42464]AEO60630.1 hypothetical protein MYCTH_2310035 [Thermothelomyces thermophilus ATCC 42464]